MGNVLQLVVFRLAERRYGLALDHVVRVTPAAAVTPTPGAPQVVLGVIDLGGDVVPVLDRESGRRGELRCSEQFLVVRSSRRLLALRVDEVEGVVERNLAQVSPFDAAPDGAPGFAGATRLDDELLLIHDIERFVSPDEAVAIDRVLEPAG